MKTNRRIQPNTTTRSTPNQSKPTRARAGEHTIKDLAPNSGRSFDPDEDHPSCLCIYDRVGKAPVSKIPLTEGEFYTLLQAFSPSSGSGALNHFIADAIREKIACLPLCHRVAREEMAMLDPIQALAVHASRTLPKDIEQRRSVLRKLRQLIPVAHPAFAPASAQLVMLDTLENLQGQLESSLS